MKMTQNEIFLPPPHSNARWWGSLHIIWQIVMKIPASDSGGWGGVGIAVITICHENQHLHLRGGASEKEDSASPREDKILPRTCICFFHRHRRYPTAKH